MTFLLETWELKPLKWNSVWLYKSNISHRHFFKQITDFTITSIRLFISLGPSTTHIMHGHLLTSSWNWGSIAQILRHYDNGEKQVENVMNKRSKSIRIQFNPITTITISNPKVNLNVSPDYQLQPSPQGAKLNPVYFETQRWERQNLLVGIRLQRWPPRLS